MTQHIELNHGDKVHQGFFTAIQQLLGASTPSLRIAVLNATTLTIVADDENKQSGVAIEGRYRWVGAADSPLLASLPGGLTNGTGSVWVTASDNDFTGPAETPDEDTDYGFALEIRASGTPSSELYRQVGEVDVKSSAIVGFRPFGGGRSSAEFGLSARPDTVNTPALYLKQLSGQSAAPVRLVDDSGNNLWTVTAGGKLTLKDTLNLFDGANNADKALILDSSGNVVASKIVNASVDSAAAIAFTKLAALTSAKILVGNGSNVATAVSVSGDVSLANDGTVTIVNDAIETAMIAGLQVTNGKIADGTIQGGKLADAPNGITNGKINNNEIQGGKLADAPNGITTGKINDNAVTTGKIANGAINEDKIQNGQVSEAKIANGAVTSEKIGTGQVSWGHIIDGNIFESKIANGAVTTPKINNNAVTEPKINDFAVQRRALADVYYTATGTTASAGLQVCVEQASVLPGIYIAMANIQGGTGGKYGFGLLGGSGNIYQSNGPYQPDTVGIFTHHAIIEVTATTKVQMTAYGVAGATHSLTLLGVFGTQ